MNSNKVIENIDKIVEALNQIKVELSLESGTVDTDLLSEGIPTDPDKNDDFSIYMPDSMADFVSANSYCITEPMSIDMWKRRDDSFVDDTYILNVVSKLKDTLHGASIPSDDIGAKSYIEAWTTTIENSPRVEYRHVHVNKGIVLRGLSLDLANAVGGLHAACLLLKTLALDIPVDSIDSAPKISRTAEEEDAIARGLIADYDYLLTQDQLFTALNTDSSVLSVPGMSELYHEFELIDSGACLYSAASILAAMYKVGRLTWDTDTNRYAIAAFTLAVLNSAIEKELDLEACMEELYKVHHIDKSKDRFLSFAQLLDAFDLDLNAVGKKIADNKLRMFRIPNSGTSAPLFAVLRSDIENC